MTQLLRDDEVLWLIVDVPEELEFLQGSKSKIDFRSFHQTDPRRCRRSWPASNGRQKRNGNVRCPRHPVYRMVKMSRACRVESKRKELRNVTGVLFVSMCALLLLVNVTAQGQEESASPAPEKKSYPEVPKEYEVGEETVSPDGRFAILYPVRDEDSNVDPGLTKYPGEDGYTFVSDEDRAKEIEFKDRKLILNIFAENKPNLAPGPVWSAELHAVWDLDKAKFDKVDFKPGEISVRKPED